MTPKQLLGTLVLSFLYCWSLPLFAASKGQMIQPDFRKGDAIPDGAAHDWNLGASGARGWIYSDKMVTSDARQIRVTEVAKGSPADGALAVGDVILGVFGKPFSSDPRTEMGLALTKAEGVDGKGALPLLRWRDGKTETVTLTLAVLGDYGERAPFACPKSKRILERGCQVLAARVSEPSYRENPITRSLNALALLASGDSRYLPLVKREATWAADFSADRFQTWYYGYVIMFLSEYVMATGDESIMPGLSRLALESAHGQSIVGSWGHRFANEKDGRLFGYGMMNSPGIPLTISLVMARAAGVKDPVVEEAIDRSTKLLKFYTGKGAVPYGDHAPWIQTHEDNGKCGMAAVLFNLLNDREAAEFFSRMSLASHGAERDTGHTGNFFNLLWALPGVSPSGAHATGAWMKEFGAWYFDLARSWDGSFSHQGPPQMKPDSYQGWDCTGAYLLAYAMPLKTVYLTGKRKSVLSPLDPAAAQEIVHDGRGWTNKERERAYDALTEKQLLSRLSNWSPVVRERAAMGLGRRKADVIAELVALLELPDLHTRYGACQALKWQRDRGAKAVGTLQRVFGEAEDLWLRILAANALAGIGEAGKLAAPELLVRLTECGSEMDPRNMEQRYLSFALFNRRGGMLGRSLEGIDRELLGKAVRAGLQNEDGRARGSYASVYQNLSFEELRPLLPAIYEAIATPSPSGVMFADTIRTSGLELFVEHRISEGIELLADYARNQKQHGSEKRIHKVLDLLKEYGAHAKRVLPHLAATADYFENEEQDFPRRLSLGKAEAVRQAIQDIETLTDFPELILLRDKKAP